jgi:hypothetical protein
MTAYGGHAGHGVLPAGSHLFTDLTHYVRGADFVLAMIRDARDINEYAFALGALAHYAADNTGHPLAINRAVPMLYPKLKKRFGDRVTYADDPISHIKTEFGFDVLQVARGRYPSQAYRDFIGFEVSKGLLQRAFQETYGLELDDLFGALDASIASYRKSVRKTIPKATKVAWELKKDEIEKSSPGITAEKFAYDYQARWAIKMLAMFIRIIPKWAVASIDFSPPTANRKLFLEFRRDRSAIQELLQAEQEGHPRFPRTLIWRIATGAISWRTILREVERLAKKDFTGVSPELRDNILSFYATVGAILDQRAPEWRDLSKPRFKAR